MEYHLLPDRTSITAGTITKTTPPPPRPKKHIFLSEKATWFDVPDDGAERCELFGMAFETFRGIFKATAVHSDQRRSG